jgi:hypothetical protein
MWKRDGILSFLDNFFGTGKRNLVRISGGDKRGEADEWPLLGLSPHLRWRRHGDTAALLLLPLGTGRDNNAAANQHFSFVSIYILTHKLAVLSDLHRMQNISGKKNKIKSKD